ncbi:MAG: YdcF family protein [Peptococcaceae bacterium]|nr:YdcF family protein [Peptococcaceae bacterium]
MIIAKNIFLVIGILLLLNLIFMFFASNFNAGLMVQGGVALGVILYAVFFEKIPKSGHSAAGIVCLISLMFIAFLVIYGKADNAIYDEDVAIVLGAGIRGEQVGPMLARRLDRAVEFYEKNPRALIAVCGGQGFQEDISEALAMERYLMARGVPQEKILKEDKSTSTYENISFAKEILDGYFPQGFSSVVITSDFHVYRAVQTARKAGVSATHLEAYTLWYAWPVNYLREMLSVVKMWVHFG